MLKKDLFDHIIYVAKFQIDTRNYGSELSYFQKQYGCENIIHTHSKRVVVTATDFSHLTASDIQFEEVTDVDTINWFFKCIETNTYTEPPWRKSSTFDNVEIFNEFIN